MPCGALDEARRQASVAHVAVGFEQLIELGVEYVVLHPTGSSLEYAADDRTNNARGSSPQVHG